MVEGRTGKSGCVKLGCFGCAALTLLTVLSVGTMVVIGALVGRPDPQIEESTVEQPLPPGPAPRPFTESRDEAGPDLPPGGLVPQIDEPGRVVLDLAMGEFEIVAGETPGPIRIESDLDSAVFELETEFERYGESGWTYEIRLKRKIGWYRMLFSVEDPSNFVRVILPPDVPLSLEGEIGMGEVRMDLGGLWLIDADLDASMGEFTIDFGEPLLAPMNDFRLVSKMGESRVRNLGNASPSSVYVRHRMGAMSLGLWGDWQNDTDVRGGVSMGEFVVWVPEDANVDIENMRQIIGASSVGDRSILEDLDVDAPTLHLDLSGGMGSIEVRRR